MCSSLLTIAGCSSDTDSTFNNSDAGKQPIELSVGVESPVTRAVVTNGTDKNLEALPKGTDLWMVMKSEYAALSGDNEHPNDLDYQGTQDSKYCVTVGTTGEKDGTKNPVTFSDGKTRYWDDAHGRSSKISVWALAVPGVNNETFNKSTKDFSTTTEGLTVDWTVPAAQTAETVKNKDLCFSNNVVGENVMKYDATANPKFGKGKLIFYHALTKITVRLVEGKGFDTSSDSDFKLDNIALNGFKLSGTFDVAQGEFTSQGGVTPITSMYNQGKVGDATHYLEALVMPGANISTANLTDAISFSVDKSAFKVSSATLLEKVRNGISDQSWTTMEAGKNYVFTFKINKTGIKVTATIAPWENVVAETEYPKINISEVYGQPTTIEPDNNFKNNFSFYLSETETPSYSKGSDVTYNASPAANERMYSFNTPLYWPNHQTHYFFRGVYPTTAPVTDGSKIAVNNAAYSEGTFPSDLMLGYPRKTDGTSDEACKVHSGTQGICATEGDIRMNFQYVMSQVEVQLSTSTGNDKVVLDGNTTIEIIGGYTSGSITLENGTATYTESDKGSYTMSGKSTSTANAYDRRDAIIPQSLTNLKFKITVKNADNTYDSYDATISGIQVGGNTIDSWAPGKIYIYKLKVTKTGIKITATLKDWETVTSDENHIWM